MLQNCTNFKMKKCILHIKLHLLMWRWRFTCRICNCKIHSSISCSILFMDMNNEESDVWRICNLCANEKGLQYKLSMNKFENHGGLAEREMKGYIKKRRNLYLGESASKIRDIMDSNQKNLQDPSWKTVLVWYSAWSLLISNCVYSVTHVHSTQYFWWC